MVREYVRDRLRAVVDAIEEVLHVASDSLAFVQLRNSSIDFLFVSFGHFIDELALQFLAIDEDASFLTFKQDAIGEVDFVFTVDFVVHLQQGSVSEFQVDGKIRCRVVGIRQRSFAVHERGPVKVFRNERRKFASGADRNGTRLVLA